MDKIWNAFREEGIGKVKVLMKRSHGMQKQAEGRSIWNIALAKDTSKA